MSIENIDKGTLPSVGLSQSEVLTMLDDFRSMDPSYAHGAMSCYSMKGSDEKQKVLEKAYMKYFHQNAVANKMMPGSLKLQENLRAMCGNLLGDGMAGVVVNFTTGGSESIFCALHAAREWAKENLSEVIEPEVVAPYSAHPAFSKGCHYLGLKLIRVPVASNLRADVAAMNDEIGPNTICVVGSAPSWPYGLYDPITALGKICDEKNIWFHVDACVGGYQAPFVTEAGYDVPDWNFKVPGVMSISADLHKYGYSAKSLSTVGWRSEAILKYHHVSPNDWPGSQYVTEGLVGSRSAGPIAGAWAVMQYLGRKGYVEYARQSMKNKSRLLKGIAEIEGLSPRESELCLAYFGSDDEDIKLEAVVGGMSQKGWKSFGTMDPPLVQLIVDPFPDDSPVIDAYLCDLAQVLRDIREGTEFADGRLGYVD